MKVTAICPWFGSNRTLAENVGKAMKGCSWVGVPFAGGLSELVHIQARTIVATDLHCHIINLANVVKDDRLRPVLIRQLNRTPFHAAELDQCQDRCKQWEGRGYSKEPSLPWAYDYFVAAWMGRSGIAGIDNQFHGQLSARWNSNGGDSAVRFRSAARALVEWGRIMRRCSFRCMDGFELIERVEDLEGNGVYADPPFPKVGERYRHNFGKDDEELGKHQRLATALTAFKAARVVCRFYDHPLVRELYPESQWAWRHYDGRKQSNALGLEVLLSNRLHRLFE